MYNEQLFFGCRGTPYRLCLQSCVRTIKNESHGHEGILSSFVSNFKDKARDTCNVWLFPFLCVFHTKNYYKFAKDKTKSTGACFFINIRIIIIIYSLIIYVQLFTAFQ